MRTLTRCWFRLSLLGLAFLSAGCARQKPQVPIEKTRPLPEVSAGAALSSYQPANPFTEMAPLVLTRTIFQAPGPAGYQVEVRDLRVAPRHQAADLTLPGAAFAEVRYGSGTFAAGDNRQKLGPGMAWSISQGQKFSLESAGDQPLIVRVHLLAAQ